MIGREEGVLPGRAVHLPPSLHPYSCGRHSAMHGGGGVSGRDVGAGVGLGLLSPNAAMQHAIEQTACSQSCAGIWKLACMCDHKDRITNRGEAHDTRRDDEKPRFQPGRRPKESAGGIFWEDPTLL